MQYLENTSHHDSVILQQSSISDEERLALIRNPDLQQYLPVEQRPVAGDDTDFFDQDTQVSRGLWMEHKRRLNEDFNLEAEWYDHAFLDDRILNEKTPITDVSVKVKTISDQQASFDFVLGGSIRMKTEGFKNMFTLKFKFVKNNNFRGLSLGHCDFVTPGYTHPYYNDINDKLVELVAENKIQKNDVLVSLLYQPEMDFRPFDFGMAILDINNRQMLIKYANQEFIHNLA